MFTPHERQHTMRDLAIILAIAVGAVLGAMAATDAQCAPYLGTPEHAVCLAYGAQVAHNHTNN